MRLIYDRKGKEHIRLTKEEKKALKGCSPEFAGRCVQGMITLGICNGTLEIIDTDQKIKERLIIGV